MPDLNPVEQMREVLVGGVGKLSSTIIKTPNKRISFGRMLFIHPEEFRDFQNNC